MRRTQPYYHRPKFLQQLHVQWLHGKQQQHFRQNDIEIDNSAGSLYRLVPCLFDRNGVGYLMEHFGEHIIMNVHSDDSFRSHDEENCEAVCLVLFVNKLLLLFFIFY